MRKVIRWVVSLGLGSLVACGDEVREQPAAGSPGVAYEQRQAPRCARCAGDAELDFHVYGRTESVWNGRAVYAAAFENDGAPTVLRRQLLLAGRIDDERFSLTCAKGIHRNSDYPSYAAFVDLNDDGECSDGDVGYFEQNYAWLYDVVTQILPSVYAEATWLPVGTLGVPLGSDALHFCAGAFYDLGSP